MNASQLIDAEYQEQRNKHKFTARYDSIRNANGQLMLAAFSLYKNPEMYPWPSDWSRSLYIHIKKKHLIEQWVVAGALLFAEKQRLYAYTARSEENAQLIATVESELNLLRHQIDEALHYPVQAYLQAISSAFKTNADIKTSWMVKLINLFVEVSEDYGLTPKKKVRAAGITLSERFWAYLLNNK